MQNIKLLLFCILVCIIIRTSKLMSRSSIGMPSEVAGVNIGRVNHNLQNTPKTILKPKNVCILLMSDEIFAKDVN